MNARPLDYAPPASPRRRRAVLALIASSVVVAAVSLSLLHARLKPAPTPIPERFIWNASGTLHDLHDALYGFEVDTGRFPSQAEGLAALTTRPAGVVYWDGPYVPRTPLDPWGNPYVYHATRGQQGQGNLVTCSGPDGIPGNADDVARGPRSCGTPYVMMVEYRIRRREALLRIAMRLPYAYMRSCNLTPTAEERLLASFEMQRSTYLLASMLRSFKPLHARTDESSIVQ